MSHNKKVDVGMYDIKNLGWPLEKYEAEEYPVIVFFGKDKREGVKYQGTKEVYEILMFVRSQAQ